MGLVIIRMDYYVVNASILVVIVQVQQLALIALRIKESHTIIKGIALQLAQANTTLKINHVLNVIPLVPLVLNNSYVQDALYNKF